MLCWRRAARQECDQRFRGLVAICSGNVKTSMLTDLGGIGSDPVFNKLSKIYNSGQNASDW